MPSLGPGATRLEWRRLRAAGVPTFSAWGREDARTPPPEPVVPEDFPEERWSAVLASLTRHAAACYRVEATLWGDLLRLPVLSRDARRGPRDPGPSARG